MIWGQTMFLSWDNALHAYRGGENLLAIAATDGAFATPSNVLYEHLAFELKLNEIPEPASTALVALGLTGAGGGASPLASSALTGSLY